MKLHHIAIAALAALSTQAFALNAADTAAAPVKLYITGSSALQAVIEGLLNQPGNCVSGTASMTGADSRACAEPSASNPAMPIPAPHWSIRRHGCSRPIEATGAPELRSPRCYRIGAKTSTLCHILGQYVEGLSLRPHSTRLFNRGDVVA